MGRCFRRWQLGNSKLGAPTCQRLNSISPYGWSCYSYNRPMPAPPKELQTKLPSATELQKFARIVLTSGPPSRNSRPLSPFDEQGS